MATQKQIEANRLNSRKSTGPRTPEGKARSSMNALKTGIDAKTQIIRGEIVTALQELTADYYDHFRPTTPDQRMLVDTLIDSEWLLRRFRAIETRLWQEALDIYDGSLGQVFTKYSDEFSRLQRRIDRTQRNYRYALDGLERLQALEAEFEPEDEPQPTTASTSASPRIQTIKPPNGFVMQSDDGRPCEPLECPPPRD